MNGGRIPGNVTAICEIFRIFYLIGNHPAKGGSEYHLMDQLSRLEQWVEYHPNSAKDKSRLHQFGPKVLPGIILVYVLYAGRIWKGDIPNRRHLKNWRRWTHQKSTPEGSMQRKC